MLRVGGMRSGPRGLALTSSSSALKPWRGGSLICALSGIVFFPLSEWLATHSCGFGAIIFWQVVFLLLFVVAIVSAPVLLIAMLFKSSRRRACVLLAFALAGVVGLFGRVRLGNVARMSGMRSFSLGTVGVYASWLPQLRHDGLSAEAELSRARVQRST